MIVAELWNQNMKESVFLPYCRSKNNRLVPTHTYTRANIHTHPNELLVATVSEPYEPLGHVLSAIMVKAKLRLSIRLPKC